MPGRRKGSEVREQLREYRRKRDFQRTAEPPGDRQPAADARGATLSFVIQKHAASHLHYDLRLELDGVMKSWAVPKGPSLDPAVKRLAMQVEDHPMDYNTFEGTIPAGEYGGGTVMLWDRGTYMPDEVPDGSPAADVVRRGLRAGKLGFTLFGERLAGSFALVRTEAGARPKWLLIKHRDAAADTGRDITADVVTSVETGRTMDEIAAESDTVWRSNRHGGAGGIERRASAAASTADALSPMLPTPAAALPDDGDWIFESWYDGLRVIAYATAAGARLVDARGRDVTARHRPVANELASLARRLDEPFVADGEIHDGSLHLSDLLLRGDDVLMSLPAADRVDALGELLKRRRLQHVRRQPTTPSPRTAARRAADAGLPGVLARRSDAPYTPGRSDALLRVTVR
jgi:bifunctional non-homologous end joining protein LigD